GFGGDVGAAGNRRDQLAVDHRDLAVEDAADDALLAPGFARLELPVGHQAGELGAGPGAAGGAVVGLAGAEDEVPALRVRPRRRADQLDVVNLLSASPCDRLRAQREADLPGEPGEAFYVGERELLAMVLREEEPVAAPGDVPGHLPVTRQ